MTLKAVYIKNGFSRSSRTNKTLRYFVLRPSAPASKMETTKMEKRKLDIAIKTLNKVSDTKQSIEEHLEQKYLKESISVEEVIYFSLASLQANSQQNKDFKAEIFLVGIALLELYAKGYNVQLNSLGHDRDKTSYSHGYSVRNIRTALQ